MKTDSDRRHQIMQLFSSLNGNERILCLLQLQTAFSENWEVALRRRPSLPTEQVDHPKHYGGDVFYEVIKVLEAELARAIWYSEYEKGFRKRLADGLIGEGLKEPKS